MYPDATRYETYLTGNADLAVMTTLEIKISGGRLVADIARYGPYDGENSGATPVYSRNATVRYYAFLVSFDN